MASTILPPRSYRRSFVSPRREAEGVMRSPPRMSTPHKTMTRGHAPEEFAYGNQLTFANGTREGADMRGEIVDLDDASPFVAEVRRLVSESCRSLKDELATVRRQRDEAVEHLITLDRAVEHLKLNASACAACSGNLVDSFTDGGSVGRDRDVGCRKGIFPTLFESVRDLASSGCNFPSSVKAFFLRAPPQQRGSEASQPLSSSTGIDPCAEMQTALALVLKCAASALQSLRKEKEALETKMRGALADLTTAADTTGSAMAMIEEFRQQAADYKKCLDQRLEDDIMDAVLLEERMRSQVNDRAMRDFHALVSGVFYPRYAELITAKSAGEKADRLCSDERSSLLLDAYERSAAQCETLREDLQAAVAISEGLSAANRALSTELARVKGLLADKEHERCVAEEKAAEASHSIASLKAQSEGASLKQSMLQEQLNDLMTQLGEQASANQKLKDRLADEKASAATKLASVSEKLKALTIACEQQVGGLIRQLEEKEKTISQMRSQINSLQKGLLDSVSTPLRSPRGATRALERSTCTAAPLEAAYSLESPQPHRPKPEAMR